MTGKAQTLMNPRHRHTPVAGVQGHTANAKRAVAAIRPDAVLHPKAWPGLRFFAEVLPDGDILPLRTHYDPQNRVPTIGVNPVTSKHPLWYTGFDLAASVLLTGGKVPRIRRAFRLVPNGTLGSLAPVAFRGDTVIDPRTDDIFRAVIEARHRVRADPTRTAAEREALQRGLKVLANSGSYGVLAEFTTHRLPGEATERVRVEYGSAPGFDTAVRGPESPGEFCFPPLAACITGAARLLLALIERLVADRGGTYLAMDTDSIHIVATESGGLVPCPSGPLTDERGRAAVRALSWAEVDAIVAALDRLKPCGPAVRGPLLKIEDENFIRKTDTRRQLYGLALAAKRYVLFNRLADGRLDIRKRSDHGLGAYLDPTDPRPRTEAPPDSDPNLGWLAAAWGRLIRRAERQGLGRPPTWLQRPALIQFTASSPDRVKPYTVRMDRRAYGDRLKPFTFMMAADVDPATIAPPLKRDRFRLVAPFERDTTRWTEAKWRDQYTGTRCRVATNGAGGPGVVVVQSIAAVIEAYWQHPEWKSTVPDPRGPQSDSIGLLPRRAVRVATVSPIGKEAGFIEAAAEGLGEADDLVVSYHLATDETATWRAIVAALRTRSTADLKTLARELRIPERALWRYREGRGRRSGNLAKLTRWFRQQTTRQS